MRRPRFTQKQLKFLELYFQGFSIQGAARSAGYKGSTPQALCNTGRRILTKFRKNPTALFHRTGVRERNIAQLLVSLPDNSKSQHEQLKALKILSRCFK